MADTEGRILIDIPGGEAERFNRLFLEKIGHPVSICHGPGHERCPILTAGQCSLFDGAHGVVFELDLDDAQHRAILASYHHDSPDKPVRVVVTPDQARRYYRILQDVEVWDHEPNVAELDGFAAEVEAFDRYS